MFVGFESATVSVGETTIFCRRKGAGPPLLLLHGFPQTHLMWHRIAPILAEEYTVVCPDLRGYGSSGKPPSTPNHAPYSKEVMARDLLGLMTALGFDQFSVAGHDRGGRVAYRMAMNHRDRIERLAVLDIIPTGEAFRRADARFALSYWPWVLFAQPEPLPEQIIATHAELIVDEALGNWGSSASAFPAPVRAAYIEALRDNATAHAICEEFRAAATLDVAADNSDRDANRHLACPLLVLWAANGPLDSWYADAGGPLGIWQQWSPRAAGRAISGGHFFPEQNPAETIAEFRTFFGIKGKPGS